jgi:hypothetical protein
MRLGSRNGAGFAGSRGVLADNHPTQAREVGFAPVAVRSLVAVDLAMVHAANIPASVKHIPVTCFVG